MFLLLHCQKMFSGGDREMVEMGWLCETTQTVVSRSSQDAQMHSDTGSGPGQACRGVEYNYNTHSIMLCAVVWWHSLPRAHLISHFRQSIHVARVTLCVHH